MTETSFVVHWITSLLRGGKKKQNSTVVAHELAIQCIPAALGQILHAQSSICESLSIS